MYPHWAHDIFLLSNTGYINRSYEKYHTLLNQHRARIDNSVSEMCPACFVREDPDHFLFSCKAFNEERGKVVEKAINREKVDSIGDINLRVLNGNIENLSIQGQAEILSALLQYIKCTNRFSNK